MVLYNSTLHEHTWYCTILLCTNTHGTVLFYFARTHMVLYYSTLHEHTWCCTISPCTLHAMLGSMQGNKKHPQWWYFTISECFHSQKNSGIANYDYREFWCSIWVCWYKDLESHNLAKVPSESVYAIHDLLFPWYKRGVDVLVSWITSLYVLVNFAQTLVDLLCTLHGRQWDLAQWLRVHYILSTNTHGTSLFCTLRVHDMLCTNPHGTSLSCTVDAMLGHQNSCFFTYCAGTLMVLYFCPLHFWCYSMQIHNLLFPWCKRGVDVLVSWIMTLYILVNFAPWMLFYANTYQGGTAVSSVSPSLMNLCNVFVAYC